MSLSCDRILIPLSEIFSPVNENIFISSFFQFFGVFSCTKYEIIVIRIDNLMMMIYLRLTKTIHTHISEKIGDFEEL